MVARRYKEYLDKMIEENKEIFASFEKIHAKYSLDQQSNQDQYNHEGSKILEIIQEYENRLCANQERGMFNKYSTQLSEKFRSEIRKIYPMIDYIGIKTEQFELKKIQLLTN